MSEGIVEQMNSLIANEYALSEQKILERQNTVNVNVSKYLALTQAK
jgi:hypothetical protein